MNAVVRLIDHELCLEVDESERSRLAEGLLVLRENAGSRASSLPALEDLGAELAKIAFRANDLSQFAQALAAAQSQGRSLRLWLCPSRLDDASMGGLPWELMRLTGPMRETCAREGVVLERDQGFLAQHPNVEFVRAVASLGGDLPREPEPTRVSDEPVRVLLVCVDRPGGRWSFLPRVKNEIDSVEKLLLSKLTRRAEVRRIDSVSVERLQQTMRDFAPHIVHFAGHGALPADTDGQTGLPALVLAGRDLRPEYLQADDLAELCRATGSKVVVLNCCNLAAAPGVVATRKAARRQSETSLNLAERLSADGTELVVAMQLAVDDSDAELLSHRLYRALLRGYELTSAVARHRYMARENRQVHRSSWLAPVVYARQRRTVIFPTPREIAEEYDFDELIRTYELGFVGRIWLFEKFSRYIANPQGKIFFLNGPAGIGKSAAVAAFVRRVQANEPENSGVRFQGEMAYVFYRYGEFSQPLDCATNLLRQLNVGTALRQELGALGDPLHAAIESVGEALRARPPDKKLLILIDGLDECSDPSRSLPIPESFLGNLPPNVAVIVAARPDWYEAWRIYHPARDGTVTLEADPRFKHFAINPLGGNNLEDAAVLIVDQLQNAASGVELKLCVEPASLVGGNMLVISMLGDEFWRGIKFDAVMAVYQEAAVAAKGAGGVEGVYRRHIERNLRADPAFACDLEVVDALLGIFATAREDVSEDQLYALLAASNPSWADDVSRRAASALRHLRRFLRTREFQSYSHPDQIAVLFSAYHKSFATFVQREVGVSSHEDRPLPTLDTETAKAFALSWAEYCTRWDELRDYPWRYALRHLPTHLMLCGKPFEKRLADTLLDYPYMVAALGAKPGEPRPLVVHELLVHYANALDVRHGLFRTGELAPKPSSRSSSAPR